MPLSNNKTLDFFSDETETETEETKSGIGETIMVVIKFIAMFYILIFITIFPIAVGITAFVSLISVLTHLSNPEAVSGKIAGKMISYLSVVVTFTLALTLFNGLKFGTGLTMIMVLAFVSMMFNMIVSRLRSYTPRDFRYVNVAQGTAAVAGIGAIVFFVNLLNVNVLRPFFNAFGDYMEKLSIQTKVINNEIETYNMFSENRVAEFSAGAGYIADLVIISVFGLLALSITGSIIVSCAAQLGLTAGKKGKRANFIFSGISAIICTILPFVVSKLQNQIYYTDEIESGKFVINEEVAGAIYSLPAATESALIGMLIGAAIILVAGIAGSVLKNKYCSDLPEEWEILILSGNAPLPGVSTGETTAPVAFSDTVENSDSNDAT